MGSAKPFCISEELVKEAYEHVRAKKGGAGVDGQTLADFEAKLEDNLYKVWNRMSSGSYFPQPVRRVEIPKLDGGKRPLGIPTVTDRIAQMVARLTLEPQVEPYFHPDSYGYRPGRSALDAVGVVRRRCWKADWVIDLDIRAFFDTIDHELLLRAVEKHTGCKWVLLYIERWLEVPVELEDGTLEERTSGTPQGGVISPLLANLFLHYAFDAWMEREVPTVPFVRYADDVVVHCKTLKQAEWLLGRIKSRLKELGLEVHPDKTRIVYCGDDPERRRSHPNITFDFLGYTFKPRLCRRGHGPTFISFTPAVSRRALGRMRSVVRSWHLTRMAEKTIEELAAIYNPTIRGWMVYFGKYRPSELSEFMRILNWRLTKWAMKKYKKLKRRTRKARRWLRRVAERQPSLFFHWSRRMPPQAG